MWMCRALCGRRARILRDVRIERLRRVSIATTVRAATLRTRMSAAAAVREAEGAVVASVGASCLSSCSWQFL